MARTQFAATSSYRESARPHRPICQQSQTTYNVLHWSLFNIYNACNNAVASLSPSLNSQRKPWRSLVRPTPQVYNPCRDSTHTASVLRTHYPPCPHYPISSASCRRLPSMSSFVSRKLSPRRNSSFELDVFDAKRYFSTAIDDDAGTFVRYPGPARQQKAAAAEKKSFDVTSGSAPVKGKGYCCTDYNKCTAKQPTSPGLRLASFINSLFQQAASKRKPKPSAPNAPTAASQKSRSNEAVYSCVSSGFTTPCLQFNTRSYVHKEKSKLRGDTNQNRKEPEGSAAYRPYAKNGIWPWKEDKYVPRGDHGLYGNVYDGDQSVCGGERRWVLSDIRKYRDDHHGYLTKRDWSWVGESTPRQRKSFKRSTEEVEEYCGEDWESDSSSDLFELQIDNSDLRRHGRSGGLPVFGTTNMKALKRGTAIATVAS